MTDQQPKCFTSVAGRRILEWILEAFKGAGLGPPVFIGGYCMDRIQEDYSELTFCHNAEWPRNNILRSLFYAEEHMAGGFVCAYSDILFRDTVVRRALAHPGDMVLCVDTDWRARYGARSQHPEDDAEKVTADGDRVRAIDRDITVGEAAGEYIGVAKFSARGAAVLKEHYHRVRREFSGRPWRGAAAFEKAYLIHLYQEMLDQGVDIRMVTTSGDYMEIDTEEDFALANRAWRAAAPEEEERPGIKSSTDK